MRFRNLLLDNLIPLIFIFGLLLLGLGMYLIDFPDPIELKVTFLSLTIAIFGQLVYKIQERIILKRSIKNHISTELYSSLLLLISGTNELSFNLKGLDRLKENSEILDVKDAAEIFFIYGQLEHYEDIWKNRSNYDYDYYIIEKKFQLICYILHFVDETIDWKRFVYILGWKVNNLNKIMLEKTDDLEFIKGFKSLYCRIAIQIDSEKLVVGSPRKSKVEFVQEFLNWIIDDHVKSNTAEHKEEIHTQVFKLIK